MRTSRRSSMGRLADKVALITGAGGGQGAAAARLFVAEGARVVLTDVADEAVDGLAASLGDAARWAHLDVGDEARWADVVRSSLEWFGRLDVLVNNAGILRFGAIADTSLADYMRVITTNQVGVFLGMRAVIPAMRRQRSGSIVNVSSTEGLAGMPGLVAYASSKWAVRGMSKVAALELGSDGIRVNSIHPGGIDTPMLRSVGGHQGGWFNGIPAGRLGT